MTIGKTDKKTGG